MSGRRRKAEQRRAFDAYYTPPGLARALVALLPVEGSVVWEPHAGGGSFVRALVQARAAVMASDVQATAQGLVEEGVAYAFDGDFLATSFLGTEVVIDWIVGNPPYGQAEAHVRHALSEARVGVAFLLRLGFLESARREGFWKEHPPHKVVVVCRRPSFTGEGSDGASYGLYIWLRGVTGDPAIAWLPGDYEV
jgi:hypothetical protein